MIPRLVSFAIGIWLMAAPAVLDYEGSAAGSDRTAGPLIAALSFVALWELGRGLRWATVPFGLWLVVAPLVLWYGELSATLNSIVCGAAVLALVPVGGRTSGNFGGGWQAVQLDIRRSQGQPG